MTPYLSLYAQLVGVGLLWVSVHCGGMCGPIVAGLSTSTCKPGQDGWRPRIANTLAYQAGRAVTYALLGAVGGLVGASLQFAVHGITRVAGLAVAAILIGAAVTRVPWLRARVGLAPPRSPFARVGRVLGAGSRRVLGHLPRRPLVRMSVMGAMMGLLPCMLMFWAWGLAAASASPLHGALLMVGLVVLTTPVLTLAGCAPLMTRKILRGRGGEGVVAYAMLASGIWLALIACAANGWIPHARLPLPFGNPPFVIMLW